jgi:PAS domain S-box-containing protein
MLLHDRLGALVRSPQRGVVAELPEIVDESDIEDRHRLLVESVTDYAIYMLDPKGIVSSWNAGAQRFKGYTKREIIGQHFSRFYTPEDIESGLPARALATARREGRFEQEGWRVRKDGSRLWAHVVIEPLYRPAGTLIGFAKITRDVTEKKSAQDALRLSEQRFRLLVQGVHDYAIYMLDPEGRVANWNTGAQRSKGYTEAEIVGEHFSRFYTEEDRQTGLPAHALDVAARESRFEQEGWRVRKDGTRYWAHVVIDAIRGDDGELLGYAKVTRDITEKRVAQEALEKAQAHFIQAQKMEAIGQLTGGMAHDFNNLLAVVLGNLDLIRKRLPPDPKLQQLIENSMQAATRGASLTQRMLAFARRQELKATTLWLPELVRGMAELLQRSIGPSIQITTQFPLRLAPALADGNQLELALLNLVVNARDAMPNGGTITISARDEILAAERDGLSAGKYVCLSVSDTGEGMDAATLARAVEPFFTTKGVGKGTGLGLSMIHGFADQSGGRLALSSTPGRGTTAELWIPAALPDQEAEQENTTGQAAGLVESPPMRVLVVDDDPLVLFNTVMMLEDLGHDVTEASSGEQALRVLRRDPGIGLLVTDQLMPGMSGTGIVEAIRGERPDLAVILATGFSDLEPDGDRNFIRLSKPFLQSELATAIATATGPAAQVLPFRARGR